MRKWLVGAALCALAGGAWASGEARDLNGDGQTDAYYDSVGDKTWLAAAWGIGTFWDIITARMETGALYGGNWDIPTMLEVPVLLQCGPSDPFGSPPSCEGGPVLSDISLLPLDFAISPTSWGNGEAIGYFTYMGETSPTWMTPILSRDRTEYQVQPTISTRTASIWLLAIGDQGAPIPAIPEPSTYLLLAAGLIAVGARHGRLYIEKPKRK